MTDSNNSEPNVSINTRTKNYFKMLVIILLGVIIIDGYGSVSPLIIK